jgi:chromosome segregation ATPase
MRSNAVVVILILACVGLGVVLLVEKNAHQNEKQLLENTITVSSNTASKLDNDLRDLTRVFVAQSNTLTAVRAQAAKTSNDLAAAQTTLSTTEASLKESQDQAAKAQAAATQAAADLAARDQEIRDLKNQNQDLDKTSNELRKTTEELRVSITNKQAEIDAKEKELENSKEDNESLSKELVRLKAEKADLEKKFNDLTVLKEQVTKLQDELTLAKKLDWIRRGIYNSFTVKGGERLMHPEPSAPPPTNASLNVELHQSGGVSVSGPGASNAPPRN